MMLEVFGIEKDKLQLGEFQDQSWLVHYCFNVVKVNLAAFAINNTLNHTSFITSVKPVS